MTRRAALSLIVLGAAVGCDGRVWIEDAATSGAGPGGSGATAGGTGGSDAIAGGTGGSAGSMWERPAAALVSCDRHTATATTAGEALIVGACFLGDAGQPADALVYDYATRSFTTIGLTQKRTWHAAARLVDGRVALVGDAANVEYVDPSAHTTELGPALIVARTEPMLLELSDGRLWVLGGFAADGATLASTEIVDPVTGTSTLGPPLTHSRARAATLPFGGVGVWLGGGEAVGSPDGPTEVLAGTEHAVCPHSPFAGDPPLVGVAGDVSAVRSGGQVAVFGEASLAWGDGASFAPAIAYDRTLASPASTITASGRFLAAGIHLYSGETQVIEATPGNAAHLLATKPGSGSNTSITPLIGSTLLVVSGEAMLLHASSD